MFPKEYDIEGKTVIVTGAARGIGKGIARVLAESRAKVMVTALTSRYLIPLSEELASAGHPIETITADATKAADWQRTVDLAMGRWGHVDVLINNLGDAIRKSLVPLPGSDAAEPITDEEWRSVLDINLTQAFMGCRAGVLTCSSVGRARSSTSAPSRPVAEVLACWFTPLPRRP